MVFSVGHATSRRDRLVRRFREYGQVARVVMGCAGFVGRAGTRPDAELGKPGREILPYFDIEVPLTFPMVPARNPQE